MPLTSGCCWEFCDIFGARDTLSTKHLMCSNAKALISGWCQFSHKGYHALRAQSCTAGPGTLRWPRYADCTKTSFLELLAPPLSCHKRLKGPCVEP